MWNNATRPVGHLWWLTSLGPPVVLAHAGGPPFWKRNHSVDSASFDHTMIGDAHRVPVESLDRAEKGESAERIRESSISCTPSRRRARAYEERCETSFREYTLTERVEQVLQRAPIRRPRQSCAAQATRLVRC